MLLRIDVFMFVNKHLVFCDLFNIVKQKFIIFSKCILQINCNHAYIIFIIFSVSKPSPWLLPYIFFLFWLIRYTRMFTIRKKISVYFCLIAALNMPSRSCYLADLHCEHWLMITLEALLKIGWNHKKKISNASHCMQSGFYLLQSWCCFKTISE